MQRRQTSGFAARSAVPCQLARTPDRDALLIAIALSSMLASSSSAQPTIIVKLSSAKVVPRLIPMPHDKRE